MTAEQAQQVASDIKAMGFEMLEILAEKSIDPNVVVPPDIAKESEAVLDRVLDKAGPLTLVLLNLVADAVSDLDPQQQGSILGMVTEQIVEWAVISGVTDGAGAVAELTGLNARLANLLESTKAFANSERLQALVRALREVKIAGRTAVQIADDLKTTMMRAWREDSGSVRNPFFGFRGERGSYWRSGKKVFPTSETTRREMRVRGKGRGGRSKWYKEEGFDLAAEQLAWLQKRYNELVVEEGFSPDFARSIVEGQILERGRSPSGPLAKILDQIFGKLEK